MTSPLVAVLMGSKSDATLMQECLDLLAKLGIPHESHVMSAHRTPDRVRDCRSSWARASRRDSTLKPGTVPGAATRW